MSEAIQINLQPVHLPMDNNTASNLGPADSAVLFEEVFRIHFTSLHSYATSIIKEEAAAEEIVQNVFFKLWEQSEKIQINVSVSAYLYKAVYNDCLNYLRHNKVKAGHYAHVTSTTTEHGDAMDPAVLKELQQKIDVALNELPEQCRTIFQLSRLDNLRYRAIADQLGISVKTVENQVAKAVRLLRTKLRGLIPVFVLLFINWNKLMS